MAVVRCPRCRDEVTVPPGATSRALVRCPLCLEQYLLAEALADAPPLLVIIGGEVQNSAISSSEDAGSDYQLAAGAYTSPLYPSAPSTTTVTIPRPVLRTSPRPRRKEKSGLVLFVNYVVGGVMGLAMGLLVLWWGFRRDPLELGPKFALYTPWIVPAQFRAKPNDAVAESPPPSGLGGTRKSSGNTKSPVAAGPHESTAELNAPHGPEEPQKLPTEALRPAIETPTEAVTAAPPMPDLTDLLP